MCWDFTRVPSTRPRTHSCCNCAIVVFENEKIKKNCVVSECQSITIARVVVFSYPNIFQEGKSIKYDGRGKTFDFNCLIMNSHVFRLRIDPFTIRVPVQCWYSHKLLFLCHMQMILKWKQLLTVDFGELCVFLFHYFRTSFWFSSDGIFCVIRLTGPHHNCARNEGPLMVTTTHFSVCFEVLEL